jgi:hypothetical protein
MVIMTAVKIEAEAKICQLDLIQIETGRDFHTDDSKPRYFLQTPRERQDEAENGSHQTKDDGAGTVVRKSVHHDGKCQDVSAHEENEAKNLGDSEDLAAPRTEQNL